MIDLTKITDESLMVARGQYSTYGAALKDSKKRLTILAGQVGTGATQVLRRMQPENDAVPEPVGELLTGMRGAIDEMEQIVDEIIAVATTRGELKPTAWGRA